MASAPRASWNATKAGDVEVGEDVAVEHQEPPVDTRRRGREADGAGRVERLGLDRVVQAGAGAVVRGRRRERVRPVPEREHHVVDAVVDEVADDVIDHRPVHDREHLLGRGVVSGRSRVPNPPTRTTARIGPAPVVPWSGRRGRGRPPVAPGRVRRRRGVGRPASAVDVVAARIVGRPRSARWAADSGSGCRSSPRGRRRSCSPRRPRGSGSVEVAADQRRLVVVALTSFHWATTSSPSSSPRSWSPSVHVWSPIVSESSVSATPAPSRKTPSVAFSPAPPSATGGCG